MEARLWLERALVNVGEYVRGSLSIHRARTTDMCGLKLALRSAACAIAPNTDAAVESEVLQRPQQQQQQQQLFSLKASICVRGRIHTPLRYVVEEQDTADLNILTSAELHADPRQYCSLPLLLIGVLCVF